MRLSILSVRNVVAGLGVFSILIAAGLASFSLFAMHLQGAALDNVILLEVALRKHEVADAVMDSVETDILRAQQFAAGGNGNGQSAIEADTYQHLDAFSDMVAGCRSLPLTPYLHERYDVLGRSILAFTSSARTAATSAFDGTDAAARSYEAFHAEFTSMEERMDQLRTVLDASLEAAQTAGAATATLSRRVIVGSTFAGIVLLAFNTIAAVAIVRRINSDLAMSREKAHHLALHDTMTGLPNRAMLAGRIAEVLGRVRNQRHAAAMLCVDLDRFKLVNDTLGHSAGDVLLQGVADRLRANVRDSDTVARLGGDEFAVVQSPVATPDEASALAQRLVEKLSEPYDVGGHQVSIGASIGVALAPSDTLDGHELMQMADLALYRAKSDGRGTFCFFERGMDAILQARRQLESDLRHAVAAGEFELHYQPLVALASGAISGFEALVRWQHPERGMIPPGEFIPVAEETGLIVPLGAWVLRQACAEAASWPSSVSVAVNVSAVQFRGDNIVGAVFDALAATGLVPGRLELEITETALLADADATLATLHHLRAFGVRIAMDDFGTGYSSLSYLRSFPFDKIKIDQSFVRDIESSVDCKAIVRAVTGLGENLGITTTAEGVETIEQLNQLRAEGCDLVQGYYLSRPVSAERVAALLDTMGAHGPKIDDPRPSHPALPEPEIALSQA